MDKALLIKAPSGIDADLLCYDELRITTRKLAAAYKLPHDGSGIVAKTAITAKIVSGNITLTGNGTTNVTWNNESSTEQTGVISIRVKPADIIYLGQMADFKSITGEGIDALQNFDMSAEMTINLSGTSVTGDISSLKTLTNLNSIYLSGTSVTGDISSLKTLTNLNTINLSGTSVTGDISSLKTLTNLNFIGLSGTSVTGDISSLKTLTNLNTIDLGSTSVTGDISSLKTLTNLNSIDLGGTSVTGDISGLTAKIWMALTNTVTGDLSTVNTKWISASGAKMSWGSTTGRSSRTDVPLSIEGGAIDLGDDLDNFIIDNAKCTNIAGQDQGKGIQVKGNRTSASDDALAALQNIGMTVTISN